MLVAKAKQGWGGFALLVLTVAFCFAVSSVPTPLYPLYIQAWQAPPSAIGDVFAIYMVAVLLTLLCLGRVSDTYGRLRVVLVALCCVLTGIALSAFSINVTMLLVARAITGLGNGLLTTAATIALIDAHPTGDKRIASIAMASGIAVGFGLGPLLGGLVAQAGFYPLITAYVPVFLVIAACAFGVWRYSKTVRPDSGFVRRPLSMRPELSLAGGANRKPFVLACLGGFANYATGCCYFSLLPALMFGALPWKGPLVMGLAFLPMAFLTLAIQISQRNVEPFKGLGIGLLSHVMAALCMLIGVLPFGTPLALFVGIVFLSMGQSYSFMCSATIANLASDPARRAANMSTYFLSAYLGASVPPMVVGRMADGLGLVRALTLYGSLLAITVAILTYLSFSWSKRRWLT
ncbi:MFS transporter [Pusillimonas sp. CC-YST705]|uniref:MFS transporter n=1 Tax=Mesopusillimonas faecipullorum TaxID=2755040 RepID=A0ABS8C9F6_9BURK|nr:MFS transporter [Mesopusillimonas faecipullorum]MCB5362666.1 MFS transporter [Mesopusillimonas faecipullorum]